MTGRKKLGSLLTIIMGLVLLAPGVAAAYSETILDTTLIRPYRWSSPAGGSYSTWRDTIGTNPSQWDIEKLVVTWSGANLEMQIYTNYPQAGLEGAGQADIALDPDQNGSWNVGVK
jgi:hypothetical protein